MKTGSRTQLNKVIMEMSKNSNDSIARASYGTMLILALFQIIRCNLPNPISSQLLYSDKAEKKKLKKSIDSVNYYFENS